MTLDSYLRDLLGQNNTGVLIVNDNASTAQLQQQPDHDVQVPLKPPSSSRRMSRSSSWYGGRPSQHTSKSSKQFTRWETISMPRRKSDSALGKPQRRTSESEEELIEDLHVARNTNMLLLAIEDDESIEFSSDGVTALSSSAAAHTPNTPGLLVRAFSDRAARPNLFNIKQLSVDQIRNSSETKQSSAGRRRLPELLLAPPSKPRRKSSMDIMEELEATTTTTISPNRPRKSPDPNKQRQQEQQQQQMMTRSSPKDAASITIKKGRNTSMDFPESLRELPYPTS